VANGRTKEDVRHVEPNYPMAKARELAAEHSFAATDVDGQLPGRGQDRQGRVQVELPPADAFLLGARPLEERRSPVKPGPPEVHEPKLPLGT
jgi:hypothetical protein